DEGRPGGAQLLLNTAGSSPSVGSAPGPRPVVPEEPRDEASRRAQVQAQAGSSTARPPSPSSSGRKVSTMTASSSKYSTPIEASEAPGCGPCAWPPGCTETEPLPIPDPLRAS